MVRLVFAAAVALLCLHAISSVSADGDVPSFDSMKIKELRKMLNDRGVKCEGCSEKKHLVEKLKETYHLPIVEQAKESDSTKVPPPELNEAELKEMMDRMKAKQEGQDPETEELLRKLKMQGFDANTLDPQVFKNMKNSKDAGKGKAPGKSTKSAPKKTKKEAESKDVKTESDGTTEEVPLETNGTETNTSGIPVNETEAALKKEKDEKARKERKEAEAQQKLYSQSHAVTKNLKEALNTYEKTMFDLTGKK